MLACALPSVVVWGLWNRLSGDLSALRAVTSPLVAGHARSRGVPSWLTPLLLHRLRHCTGRVSQVLPQSASVGLNQSGLEQIKIRGRSTAELILGEGQ